MSQNKSLLIIYKMLVVVAEGYLADMVDLFPGIIYFPEFAGGGRL